MLDEPLFLDADRAPENTYQISPEWVSSDAPLFPRLDSFTDSRKLWNNSAAADLVTQPYPYYLKDNMLAADGFKDLLAHWPHKYAFKYLSGFNRYSLRMQSHTGWEDLTGNQRDFWRHFIAQVCPRVIRESIRLFAPQIIARHGAHIGEVQLQNVEILELFDAQLPISVHSHHFHSPLWLGTAVYYVDDNGHTGRGTTVYRAKEGYDSPEQLAALAGNHRALDESSQIERCATLDFAPNRVFVMYDNPIGWHKVEDNTQLGHVGPRRHLLFNWGLPFDAMESHYGVDRLTFMDIHEKQQGSPRVLSWLQKDIQALKAAVPPSAAQMEELEQSVVVRGLGALDLF